MFPTPSSLCPQPQLPGGRVALVALVAGRHWSHPPGLVSQHISFPSLPPARPQRMCHPPQQPAASPGCPQGHQGVRLAPQPGVPKPAVTQRHQASPGSGSHLRFGVYGVLPSMPTCSRACGAQQGRGSWALVAHPLPLSPGMTPSISMLHGKAGGNV